MANQLQTRSRGDLRPGSGFEMLQRQIDDLFEDFASGFRPALLGGDMERMLMPSIDVHEADGKVIVSTELPGVKEEDVDISVDGDMLTISGEKKSMMESGKADQYRSERVYGKFARTIELPFDIDPEKVDARFENGVLTLTIERPQEAAEKQRKIPIRH